MSQRELEDKSLISAEPGHGLTVLSLLPGSTWDSESFILSYISKNMKIFLVIFVFVIDYVDNNYI